MADVVQIIDTLDSKTILSLFDEGISGKRFEFKTVDPNEVARRIAVRDLEANSLDELLGGSESEVISGRNYIGKPFTLVRVEWQKSDDKYDAGLPFYAVCHIVTLDGEPKVLTTGATTIVRKLAKIDYENWYPAKLKIVKGDKTDAGFEPLDLAKADF